MPKERFVIINNTESLSPNTKMGCLAFDRAHRLGFNGNGELIVLALDSYDSEVPSELLDLKALQLVSTSFVEKYNVTCKEDIFYLARHKTEDKIDEIHSFQKKVLFIDPSTAEGHKACSEIKNIPPRKRMQFISKVVWQYLVQTENKYYIEQSVLRMKLLIEKLEAADLDEIANLIWVVGQKN